MKVAFLGLGIMGGRMAANLVKKGHTVTVWNRSAERAKPLQQLGAAIASSPRDAVTGAEVICLCLTTPEVVAATLPFGSVAKGALIIDFSTGTPGFAQTLDASARERSARFVEAPMTGSKNGAEAGTLVLMIGAEKADLEAARPILACVASKIIHVGAVGAATRVKLMGNTFIALMLEALCESIALCRKAGIDPKTMLEVVQASGYASPYWEFKSKPILSRDFDTHFSIDLMHKDLTFALEQANELKVAVPGLAMVREQFQAARASGMGGEDIAALTKIVERASGL